MGSHGEVMRDEDARRDRKGGGIKYVTRMAKKTSSGSLRRSISFLLEVATRANAKHSDIKEKALI